MGKGDMDQGLRNLLEEMMQLISEAVRERMESEKFHDSFDKVNQRMSDQYGRIVGAIALRLEFVTAPVLGGGGRRGKANLSLNFKFGGSEEDRKMEEEFGLDEQEMNRLLEQARQERAGRGNIAPADIGATSRPPAETEKAAEPADSRSVSQIINSIREIARALNLKQRRLLAENLGEKWVKQRGIAITEEQIKNNTTWLQSVQSIINEIQKRRPRDLSKKTLLALLEGLFKRVSAE